jgi:hypothetical protein
VQARFTLLALLTAPLATACLGTSDDFTFGGAGAGSAASGGNAGLGGGGGFGGGQSRSPLPDLYYRAFP